ncbi:MAG: putative voltage-gated potassium channel subunit beta [Acidimicrobiales bacterium]|nr:putative voltage-gated potassium channel subunit beta [Acidimicrobiales bacterium]
MRAAREAGITFLDDARYNDETGTAPIRTGYSEVVFGELFRAAGWRRDETVVANKLWWEFWPDQSPTEELDGSLTRMGFDYVDVIYTDRPPDGVALDELVGSVGALIEAGKARYWGVLNWPASLVGDATIVAEREGLPPMIANQLQYSVVARSPVEDAEMVDAMRGAGASVVASFVLAGGILSGKYLGPGGSATSGRAAGALDDPRSRSAVAAAGELAALASELGCDAASLAIAFALLNDSVATVLFGATGPDQVERNVAALAIADRLDADQTARLRAIAS